MWREEIQERTLQPVQQTLKEQKKSTKANELDELKKNFTLIHNVCEFHS